MTGLEEKVAVQLLRDEVLDTYLSGGLSGEGERKAYQVAVKAVLAALESQGLKIVPVEPSGTTLKAIAQALWAHLPIPNGKWPESPTHTTRFLTRQAKAAHAAMLNAVQEG